MVKKTPRANPVSRKRKRTPRPGMSRAVKPRLAISKPRPQKALTLSVGQRAAANYIMGLCKGKIIPSDNLPCSDPTPFRPLVVRYRVAPFVNANGGVNLVFNPHFMWCTNGLNFISNYTTGTVSNVLPIYLGSTAGAAGDFNFNSSVGITQNGAIVNSSGAFSGTQYSGGVRFCGAEINFQSTSTTLNTGGVLYYCHNPQNRSLISSQANLGTGVITLDSPSFTDVVTAMDSTAWHNVSTDPVHICVLPHSTEYEVISTDAILDITGVGAGAVSASAAQLAALEEYVPCSNAERTHKGWNHSIIYIPAQTLAPGAAAQCIFEIVCHYHVNVDICTTGAIGTGWGSTASTMLTSSSVADPVGKAAIETALVTIKKNRAVASSTIQVRDDPPPPSLASEILQGVASVAKPIADVVSNLLGKTNPIGMLAQGISSLFTSR